MYNPQIAATIGPKLAAEAEVLERIGANAALPPGVAAKIDVGRFLLT